jgi:penicillin-binding protein 1A
MKGKDAKKLSALIASYLHNGKVQNSYPSQPSGVVKASCISGIYPYVKAGSNVPSSRIVSGWFKSTNTPSGTASGASLNSLSSFDASSSNGSITVTFTEYDPKSMTQKSSNPTKTYKVGGKSYTLPYYGDINQIYGRVVYAVEVKDSSGNVVATEKLNSATGTLSYKPSSGTYTVTGYYAFESSSGTSNKISKTITVESQLGASYTVVTDDATQLILHVKVPSGNTVTIKAGSSSQSMTTSGKVTLTNMTSGTVVTLTETTKDGKTQELASYTYIGE